MKTGILASGITPDELLSEYGSYADMFKALFREAGYQIDFEVFDVREGDFPDNAVQCDSWIITGSRHGVYENQPWMLKLQQLVREIADSGRPLVGICFGHQIVAQALGGTVEKSDKGWGIGLHRYELLGSYDFIEDDVSSFAISAMHQDQVIVKPENAEVIARSEFCEYGALLYNDQILTFQAHPEFRIDFERELISLRSGEPIPTERAEQGLASIAADGACTDSIQVAHWMAKFLLARVEN